MRAYREIFDGCAYSVIVNARISHSYWEGAKVVRSTIAGNRSWLSTAMPFYQLLCISTHYSDYVSLNFYVFFPQF